VITIASEVVTELNVALICESIRPLELDADLPGRSVYALQLGRHLARLGVGVDIFVRRIAPDDARITEVEPGLRLVTVAAGPAGPRQRRTLWMIAPQVRDQVLRFMLAEGVRYDVVHATSWIAGVAAAEVAQRSDLPYTQLLQAPKLSKEHHLDDENASPPQRVQFELDFTRQAAALIARTPYERAHVVEAYRADPRRVAIIPWGVDLELFKPGDRAHARRQLGLDQTGSILLHVGRPLARTGVHDLLRAVALLEDLPGGPPQLLLVGGDTREPDAVTNKEVGDLWQLAAELGVTEHVRFVGRRARHELPAYYAAADVVTAVPWHEPYGQQVREALACARPVVGSDVGGIADVLVGEQMGALVSPEDPRDLAAKLRRLLRSPGLRGRLGRAGRAYAEEQLGWPRVAEATREVFARTARVTAGPAPLPRPTPTGARTLDAPPA
jgi:D-inositol-3-phosphate glycosyltransferase